MTTFVVPGPPIPKGRPRLNTHTGVWYTPTRTKHYEELVAECAMTSGLRLEPKKKYALEITLYVSTYRGDCSNVAKSLEDGLNTYAKHDGWDDRQIVDLIVRQVGVADASEEKAVVSIEERA